jgi:DNA-binding NarL/FixJ family response regulator
VSASLALSRAFAAALASVGWRDVRVGGEAQVVAPAAVVSSPLRLVLVADEHGWLPELPSADLSAAGVGSTVVVVGGRCAASALLSAVERGAQLVDGEQSIQAQIRQTHRALVGGSEKVGSSDALTAELRERVREAAALDTLTAREREVLDALACGESAAGIAARWIVALPTIRTHIRAVLRKLDVPSQVAAVAVVVRAGCPQVPWLTHAHQF